MWIASVREKCNTHFFSEKNKIWTGYHYLYMLVGYLWKVICVFVIILPSRHFDPNSHFFNWNNLPSQPQIFMTLNLSFGDK